MANIKTNRFGEELREFNISIGEYQRDVQKYYEGKGVKNVTVRVLEDVPRIMHKYDSDERKKYITRDATVIGPINIYFMCIYYDDIRTDMYNALMLCSEFDIESVTFILVDTKRCGEHADLMICTDF